MLTKLRKSADYSLIGFIIAGIFGAVNRFKILFRSPPHIYFYIQRDRPERFFYPNESNQNTMF